MSRRCSALLLALSLAACGGSGTEAPFGEPSQSSDAATFDAPSSIVTTDSGARADGKSSDSGTATPSSDAGASLDVGLDAGADASTTTKAGASLLAAEAHREVTAMISSTYQHTTYVDEATGEFDYDCSGFVNYALSRVLPDAWTTLAGATEARPLAKDYEEFFASIASTTTASGRWRRVARAIDLVPGDVVSWLEPPGTATADTGHVMIVRALPTPNPSDSTEILVPITDSTSTPHGPSDSRTPSGATGLGTATIGLVVDSSGAPIEYRWTGGYSTARVATSIALGHVE